MKAKRWMRYLAMALTLALVMTTPLQASEYVSEDTTEAVPAVAPADEDAGDEILSGEEDLPAETDPAEAVFEEGTASVSEISEDGPTVEITNIAEIASNSAEAATIGTTSATFRTGVWLHVVNGNFNGSYKVEEVKAAVSEGGTEDRYIVEPGDGSSIEENGEGVKDISGESSIWVRAQGLNRLPKNVKNIKVVRSNGTFDGWYTEAPTEELQSKGGYSVWHTVHTNGDKIEPGAAIPEGVHVLYAVFNDKDAEKEEVEDDDKLVTFYLDWNGINGQFGHCLTCTRSYDEGNAKFTAEDAAVYGLNYGYKYHDRINKGSQKGDDEEQARKAEEALQKENEELAKKYGSGGEYCLEGKEKSEDKWNTLKNLWAEATFNGYTFKGWSTQRHGGEIIKEDTPITNGVSLYAQWEKESGESSDTFEAVDPDAGPLEFIRIVAGAGTTFTSGTLSASTHGAKGASLTLNLFCTPVRAELKDVTWTLEISEGLEDGASLAELFKAKKKLEIKGGTTSSEETYKVGDEGKETDALKVTAKGNTLTVTNMDGKARSVVVSATAKGTGEKIATAPTSATLSFVHYWKKNENSAQETQKLNAEVKESDKNICKPSETITYTCTDCGETKTEHTPPLEHVYNFASGQHSSVKTTKEPTCTEDGEKEYTYKCLRQGCEGETELTVKVPALGHEWSDEVVTPVSCNKNMVTKRCERKGCTVQETSLVPANNPELHQWQETRRDHNTCKQDTVYETCSVCGETKSYTEAADNEHQYVYDSSMRNDCDWVTYTFKCVYGCGATEVKLKQEKGHDWGDWTVSSSMDRETGTMTRTRTHTCNRCQETETEVLESWVETEADTSSGQTVDAAENNLSEAQSVYAYAPASINEDETNETTVKNNALQTVSVKKSSVVKAASQEKSAEKSGWQKVGKKKYYYVNGVKQTGWKKIGKKKYYFGKNGVMQTGWKKIGKKKYYFGKDGVMRTGKQKIGKKIYIFGKNGALKK